MASLRLDGGFINLGGFRSTQLRKPSPRSCRAMAASGSSDGNKRMEIVYDFSQRMEQLTNQLKDAAGNLPMRSLNLFSPAKVNLFLRVTGKRADGYHELASLFHVISLGDILKFSISPSKTKDSLTTNMAGIPLDDRNLVIKALNLYRKKTGSDNHFWIHLDKRVPSGAGLGGGSGNAATALWAANKFNGDLVNEQDLQEWSGELGSDVPFFFSCGAAYCTGRGEVVKNVPAPLPLHTPMVLMKPKEACPTADVYKHFRLENASSADPQNLLEQVLQSGMSQNVCINDLETPAFEVLPLLKALKQRIILSSRGRYSCVFMSGSGSTLVGIGDPEPPQFMYDEEQFSDTFISDAYFLTRRENEWYQQPLSTSTPSSAATDRYDTVQDKQLGGPAST